MTRSLRILAFAFLVAAGAAAAQPEVAFADLAPILEARCTMCHAGPNAAAGLALDDAASLLAGSARGPVVVPGDPEASELIRRLRGTSLPRMPLTGPPYLEDADIDRFARWIAAGAAPGTAATEAVDDADAASPTGPVTYADVAPILARHCVRCHAAQGLMGRAPAGYRLDTYAEALRFDDRARVVPFAPDASELVRRVLGHATPRMPLDGPPWLDDAELDRIAAWVADGARDEDGTPAFVPWGAELRLHGTWRADGTLDGLPLDLAGARIDDDVRRGTMVEVRAVLGADGEVLVTRVRAR